MIHKLLFVCFLGMVGIVGMLGIAYPTSFRMKQVSYHTRNFAWKFNMGTEITIAFGDHHNVAFLAKRYPPCQLFHYDMINATHGNIYDTFNPVERKLIYQFASSYGSFVLYKTDVYLQSYVLTSHSSYHPRWYLNQDGDSVAVMLTPNTGVLFDVLLTKRNNILHVGKWLENLTTFPFYQNQTYVPI